MVTSSNREKMLKHYMHTNDFELDHHRDITYPAVEPHYHEFYELLYFISGHVDYIIGDEIYHLQNDDLLIIPPNVMHNPIFADFRVPYERYVLWISLPTLQQLASIDEDLNYFLTAKGMKNYLLRRHTTAWGNFRTIFTSLEEALGEQKPLRHAQVKAFILHLLVEYNLALMEDSGTAQSGVRDNPLTDILHYIQNHLTEDLSMDTISGAFIMDKYNLAHMFKDKMGISYYQYVLQQRLLTGKNLILEGVPANKACFAYGFNDYSSFFRAFKKEYEVSPAAFRRIHEGMIG